MKDGEAVTTDEKKVEETATEKTTTETHDEPGKAAVHTEKVETEKKAE